MDRISDLPDPIQSHIVSLLPLEDAIRTSILSKTMDELLLSYPTLIFLNGSLLLLITMFKSFLRLLSLQFINLELPTLTELPMLKTFKLRCVKLCGEDPLNQLISNCPVLEEFFMQGCLWGSQTVLNISAPTLIAVLNISSPTLKSLDLDFLYPFPALAIKISASNLHEIIYLGHHLPDISSQTLSSLKDSSFLLQEFRRAIQAERDAISHNVCQEDLYRTPQCHQIMFKRVAILKMSSQYLAYLVDLSEYHLTLW
ncbi:hypothetical protein AQUCO_02200165v1 [Aquilegia coerulea]|uniref:F-box domain-containing protein n=1 Tax=Aquilegia coerulea TaxID=218851 RepID=A0A2G5DDI4_AQUCA|nr:hypothetical protein AQUCO_02200165v1 [Aquilegia coerulea]